MEITVEKLRELKKDEYKLTDIRDRSSFEYGSAENAVNVPFSELDESALDKTKKNILICKNGEKSKQAADDFCKCGKEVYFLKGGYLRWLKCRQENEDYGMAAEKAETSIRKKFHKQLFTKFARAINDYKLVEENDKVAVCISGGKDSVLMAKLFQELKRHNKFHFELVFLVMNPGYSPENMELIEHNAKKLDIPITVFESDIFDSVFNIEKSPCYVCARMRRGHLYSQAKKLGCNKIALGHHYDDVIETILMGMLYSGQIQTMMPKLKSTNFEGMELIRPMYLIREEDIKKWRDYNELRFLQCACRFTETAEAEEKSSDMFTSKRLETKQIIKKLQQINPYAEGNIFKSVQNVNLETVIEYKDKNGRHSFLDEY